MNGRVAVTLIRAARREAEEKGTVAKGIYRNFKRIHKAKTYPWQKEPKINAMQKEANQAMVEMAEKVYGLNGDYPVARRSNLNSRQRRRDKINKQWNSPEN